MVRRGVLVFVSTLVAVVVAVGFFATSVEVPVATSSSSTVTSSSDNLLRGTGPVSTFPKSWDDPCEELVSGNGTTGGTNYAGNPLVPNLNLTQVYSAIVSSSAFQKLAAGRSWVTIDWSIAQMGPAPPPTVVVGQFLFVSGGIPVPYGFVQMEYYVASGAVAGGFVQDQSTCVEGGSGPGFSYGIRLSTGTYAPGQPVGINFTFTNLTNTTMTIAGRNSCLGNFTVLQGFYGPVVYDSAQHPLCTGPPLRVVLSAGKTVSQTVEWNQTDDGGAQVPPGDYFVFGTETGYLGQIFSVSLPEGLTIDNQTASTAASPVSDGLRLSASINSTDLRVGQSLNVSISVTNTLAVATGFYGLSGQPDNGAHVPGSEPGNWTFYGVPAFTFPQCRTYPWPAPISVLVLSGNYSVGQLAAVANSSLPFPCTGGGSPSFPYYTFEPKSDVINLTAQFDGGVGVRSLGEFRLASNFTAGGYWNLGDLASEGPGSYGCIPETPDIPPNYCALPTSISFAPGVYTVGVSDEWGQAVVLHFTVIN